MKRHANLFEDIASFESLAIAERRARRGKRDRSDVGEYRSNVESRLVDLSARLRSRTYRPGDFKVFKVQDPKSRIIAAPPFEDRIVHHALCANIEPIFDRSFIFDSYACRRGKGTHAALNRLETFLVPDDYVLQCDIRSFFPSIDHNVLKHLIRKKIKCPGTLWLCDLIIDSGGSLSEVGGIRLPIGALTSQLFANVVLNQLDHFAKQELGVKRYLRYCDDFLLLSAEKGRLADWRDEIEGFLLDQLRLTLHPAKRQIYPCRTGVAFVGFRLFPNGHRRLIATNGRRFSRRLLGQVREVAAGRMGDDSARRRVLGWQTHASHGHTAQLQRSVRSRSSVELRSSNHKHPACRRGRQSSERLERTNSERRPAFS